MQAISIPIVIFLIIIYLYKIWRKNPIIIFIGSVFFYRDDMANSFHYMD